MVIAGQVQDGFEIMVQADFRNFALDRYQAKQVGDNEILLMFPSVLSASYVENIQQLMACHTKESSASYPVVLAMMVHVNAYKNNESRKVKYILLRFPENTVFDKETEEFKHPEARLIHKTIEIIRRFFWRFYFREAEHRVASVVKNQCIGVSKLAGLMMTSTKNHC